MNDARGAYWSDERIARLLALFHPELTEALALDVEEFHAEAERKTDMPGVREALQAEPEQDRL